MNTCAVYIMTNKSNRVLYTGVTSNLVNRVYVHRNHLLPGFTSRYNCTKLVYIEYFGDIVMAIEREKQIKNYSRRKKIELIERSNSEWKDLSSDI